MLGLYSSSARLSETATVTLSTLSLVCFLHLHPQPSYYSFVYLFPVCHLSVTWQTLADYLLCAWYVLGVKDVTTGTYISVLVELVW